MTNKQEQPQIDADAQKRIEQFVAVRDKIAAIKAEHEKQLAPLTEIQTILTGWLQDFMDKIGCDSIKTSNGTCYKSSRYTASVADGEAFMNYIIANSKYELLDRRANATAVRDFVEQTGALPPGVNLSAIRTVGVRRAPGK
jgi:hypothetical protein